MKLSHSLLLVVCSLTCVALPCFAGINALSNPDFELGLAGWAVNPSGYATAADKDSYPLYMPGADGGKFAQFWSGTSGDTVSIRQDVTEGVAPGQYWTFSGRVMNAPGYEVPAENFGRVRIEYLGGTGPVLEENINLHAAPLGTWMPFSYTATTPTPEWITGVRFWAEYVQPVASSGGVLGYDDLSAISEVPELSTTGLLGGAAALLMAGAHRWRQKRAATRAA